jgi:hypothetical protein
MFCLKYARLYISCGNSTVYVGKRHNLRTSAKQVHNVRTTVILLCGCVNTVDVKNQHVLHILGVCL